MTHPQNNTTHKPNQQIKTIRKKGKTNEWTAKNKLHNKKQNKNKTKHINTSKHTFKGSL